MAGLAILCALVVSMSVASAGTECDPRGEGSARRRRSSPRSRPPAVPGAAAIKKKYGGQTITFVGDSVGGGHTRDLALAQKFSASTGIKVNVDAASHRVGRVVLAARESVLVEVGLDRRGDDRRRVAGRLRAVPRRPEAEARQAGQAPRAGHRLERHRRRAPRRDAVVRRLRDPLLPHRPAEEVRLQGPAEDLGSSSSRTAKKIQDGEQAIEPELLRASSSRATRTRA